MPPPYRQAFALTLVAGTLLGAAASALLTRSFRWTLPASDTLSRLLLGQTFLGIGGIVAGGCNIGRGLSALSTVSIKALIAVTAIVTGMRLGLAWIQRVEGLSKHSAELVQWERLLEGADDAHTLRLR